MLGNVCDVQYVRNVFKIIIKLLIILSIGKVAAHK